jgi:hypothetical protein
MIARNQAFIGGLGVTSTWSPGIGAARERPRSVRSGKIQSLMLNRVSARSSGLIAPLDAPVIGKLGRLP